MASSIEHQGDGKEVEGDTVPQIRGGVIGQHAGDGTVRPRSQPVSVKRMLHCGRGFSLPYQQSRPGRYMILTLIARARTGRIQGERPGSKLGAVGVEIPCLVKDGVVSWGLELPGGGILGRHSSRSSVTVIKLR